MIDTEREYTPEETIGVWNDCDMIHILNTDITVVGLITKACEDYVSLCPLYVHGDNNCKRGDKVRVTGKLYTDNEGDICITNNNFEVITEDEEESKSDFSEYLNPLSEVLNIYRTKSNYKLAGTVVYTSGYFNSEIETLCDNGLSFPLRFHDIEPPSADMHICVKGFLYKKDKQLNIKVTKWCVK